MSEYLKRPADTTDQDEESSVIGLTVNNEEISVSKKIAILAWENFMKRIALKLDEAEAKNILLMELATFAQEGTIPTTQIRGSDADQSYLELKQYLEGNLEPNNSHILKLVSRGRSLAQISRKIKSEVRVMAQENQAMKLRTQAERVMDEARKHIEKDIRKNIGRSADASTDLERLEKLETLFKEFEQTYDDLFNDYNANEAQIELYLAELKNIIFRMRSQYENE
jgi:hypothetical protein